MAPAMKSTAWMQGQFLVGPESKHARLGVNRPTVKGEHNLDIFAGQISYDFGLSEAMWQRAIKAGDEY